MKTLEKLQAYNTPGKLNNFSSSVDDVKAQETNLNAQTELELPTAAADWCSIAGW